MQDDEDVAGMRIGMEVSRHRDLIEVRARKLVGERREIVIDPRDRRNLVDLDTAHALHRENLVRRVRVDDARNQDVRKTCQVAAECCSVARFGPVVELVGQRPLQLLNDANHVHALAGARVLGEKLRHLAEELDVVLENLPDARTLNLHHDVATVAQLRGVHLAEAGASERLVVELGEQIADAGAQLFLDRLFDVGEGHRLDVVLEMLQLLDVALRNEIGTSGKNLAELDVGGAELHEPLAESLGLFRFGCLVVLGTPTGGIPRWRAIPARERSRGGRNA